MWLGGGGDPYTAACTHRINAVLAVSLCKSLNSGWVFCLVAEAVPTCRGVAILRKRQLDERACNGGVAASACFAAACCEPLSQPGGRVGGCGRCTVRCLFSCIGQGPVSGAPKAHAAV